MVEAKFQMSKKTRTRLKLVLLTAFILLFEYGFTVGYCNELNKVLWFDFALNFSDESVILILDQRVGHIDQSGRITIEPQFKGIGSFSNGLAPIRIKGLWGFIDHASETVIKPEFEGVGRFRKGMARIRMKGRWGYIDKTGQMVIKPQFNQAKAFSQDLACIGMRENPDTKYGYIDRENRIVIPPQFDHGHNFSGGFALVKLEGRWGAVDVNGNFLRQP